MKLHCFSVFNCSSRISIFCWSLFFYDKISLFFFILFSYNFDNSFKELFLSIISMFRWQICAFLFSISLFKFWMLSISFLWNLREFSWLSINDLSNSRIFDFFFSGSNSLYCSSHSSTDSKIGKSLKNFFIVFSHLNTMDLKDSLEKFFWSFILIYYAF